jgi:hypothetical protein
LKRETRGEAKKREAQERASTIASLRFAHASDQETAFRHTGWRVRREKVTRTLAATGASDLALHNWTNCGSHAVVEWSPRENRFRVRANYCRSRHCEPCARTKANTIARNLETRLAQGDGSNYRFVTLTLAHTEAPLAHQIKRLYASFRKLRTAGVWKDSQAGGAFMLEVKRAKDRWHPHLHIVAEGRFLHQAALSTAWRKATGDSYIVDVRAIKSGRDAAFYVAKYVTKGTSVGVWDEPDAAAEWVTATKGVRTCATYGTWRGKSLLKIDGGADDWQPLCTLDQLHRDAAQGKPGARELLNELLSHRPAQEEPRPPPSQRPKRSTANS